MEKKNSSYAEGFGTRIFLFSFAASLLIRFVHQYLLIPFILDLFLLLRHNFKVHLVDNMLFNSCYYNFLMRDWTLVFVNAGFNFVFYSIIFKDYITT